MRSVLSIFNFFDAALCVDGYSGLSVQVLRIGPLLLVSSPDGIPIWMLLNTTEACHDCPWAAHVVFILNLNDTLFAEQSVFEIQDNPPTSPAPFLHSHV